MLSHRSLNLQNLNSGAGGKSLHEVTKPATPNIPAETYKPLRIIYEVYHLTTFDSAKNAVFSIKMHFFTFFPKKIYIYSIGTNA